MNTKESYPILKIPQTIKIIATEIPNFRKPLEPEKPILKIASEPTSPILLGSFKAFLVTLLITFFCGVFVYFIIPIIETAQSSGQSFLAWITYPIMCISIISGLVAFSNFTGMFKKNKTGDQYAYELNKYKSDVKENNNIFEKELLLYNSEKIPRYQRDIEDYSEKQKLLYDKHYINDYRYNKLSKLVDMRIFKNTPICNDNNLSINYFSQRLSSVLQQFNQEITIIENISIKDFIPDFLIHVKRLGVYIVIAIDEPYNEKDGEPKHFINSFESNDRHVDDFIVKQNFVLVRFAEIQMFKSISECLTFVQKLIRNFLNLNFNADVTRLYNGIVINQWTKEEAYKLAYEKFRDKYLPPDYKNKILEESKRVNYNMSKCKLLTDEEIYNLTWNEDCADSLINKHEQGDENTVIDIDGNIYKTVRIGNQTWMAENLKVRRYRNGDLIPNIQDNKAWCNLKIGAWCNYDNQQFYESQYGKLYNWFALDDNRILAPEGWHIPSYSEWETLIVNLGGIKSSREVLRDSNVHSWGNPTNGDTDAISIRTIYGGSRSAEGVFYKNKQSDYWWSYLGISAVNWGISENLGTSYAFQYFETKLGGYSVRCVMD